MGEIVNLNRVRKQRTRATAEREARENRVRHGRSKVARDNDRRAAKRQAEAQEGMRIEPDRGGHPSPPPVADGQPQGR